MGLKVECLCNMGPGMSLVFSGLLLIQMGKSLVSKDPLSSGSRVCWVRTEVLSTA